MEFKNIFRELRQSKKISQNQIAKDLDVSNAVISYWETGRNEPTLPMIKKIAQYFNVSADYLVGLEDEYGHKIDSNGDMYVKVVARSKGNTVKPHYEKLTPEDIKLFEEIIAKLKKE